jgi:7-cyano-7-deazaguanine reductase
MTNADQVKKTHPRRSGVQKKIMPAPRLSAAFNNRYRATTHWRNSGHAGIPRSLADDAVCVFQREPKILYFISSYFIQDRNIKRMMSEKTSLLETFENAFPNRDYRIVHTSPEFTSLCPKTGQPDFAVITLEYIPDLLCIELKSLKIYYTSYRNDGIFYESVTNRILDDLAACCKPRYMKVTANFAVRGGISSVITAEYAQPDFSNPR